MHLRHFRSILGSDDNSVSYETLRLMKREEVFLDPPWSFSYCCGVLFCTKYTSVHRPVASTSYLGGLSCNLKIRGRHEVPSPRPRSGRGSSWGGRGASGRTCHLEDNGGRDGLTSEDQNCTKYQGS